MYSCPMRFAAVISFVVLLTGPAVAGEMQLATDVNLVTALDVSDSIMRHDEWLQFQGLASAITHPSFLRAVASGRHRRIGFAAFAWSSDGAFDVIVPWKVVDSRAGAMQVAAMLESWPRASSRGWPRTDAERHTDLSAAIDYAATLADRRPFRGHTVVNVAANGIDNVGVGPDTARDRAVAAGLVVNGLVIGGRKGVADHFRSHVQGGPGSFVAEVFEPADMAKAMLDKLLRDLISAAASESWT